MLSAFDWFLLRKIGRLLMYKPNHVGLTVDENTASIY